MAVTAGHAAVANSGLCRVDELDESIARLERARAVQAHRLNGLRQDKRQGDQQLAAVLVEYDSSVLARARALERDAARAQPLA